MWVVVVVVNSWGRAPNEREIGTQFHFYHTEVDEKVSPRARYEERGRARSLPVVIAAMAAARAMGDDDESPVEDGCGPETRHGILEYFSKLFPPPPQ